MTADVISALAAELGNEILFGDDIPARNKRDWNSPDPVCPIAVARPAMPEGVAAVQRICATHGVAVVPQGGLTGLCGGAQPVAGCVALSLERLVGIEEIDPVSSTMTVRAGTTLEAVQKAAAEAGLFCALDLGARGSCSVGGNLSTNAGGNRVIRYGMAREMVLGIEVALPDGTLMTSLNKMLKNNAGYDLKQLFIGSEGTLGVITRIVLRLFPQPAATMTAVCGLADYDAVLRMLAGARQTLGPLLSAFEVMWPDYFDTATRRLPSIRRPLAGDHGIYVLLEAQGNDPVSDPRHFEAWLGGLLEAGVVEDAAIAQSVADATSFWDVRDAGAEFKALIGAFGSFDIGLPVDRMNDFVRICQSTLSAELPGCASFFFGHIADGNMHIMVGMPGVATPPLKAIDEVVYRLVRQHGGTISSEHGIGVKKKAYLPYSRTPEEIALMKTLKAALDPKGILNPGKVV
ncbi:FAD-binding oxidoreductase [Mesorhizobium sp. CO1-1-8]|uniref:FAD-binding oxidoreductase n=1 Tax=Mesorhizobium sp. CO1-1-8 TaxID=2876631 RepID=UPI001CD10B7D|nr:FAD-binding oxidoreductase [Mesorhizobium sp. CO1-1-8]MBZ9772239.1 FAD-binding oxidoreductase [Mesorhizobium sp. CO1-1-8]